MMHISELLSQKQKEAIQNTKEEIIRENSYLRGYVYSTVAVPYLPEYPPRVFRCSDGYFSCQDCSKSPHGNTCSGETFFSKGTLKNSKPASGKAVPINCMRQVKIRPFVVLQTSHPAFNIECYGSRFIFGAPIKSIKGWMESVSTNSDGSKEFKENAEKAADLIRNNKHLLFYYVKDKKQGVKRESYIDLTSMCALPEEFFISNKPRGILSDEDLYNISKKIEALLDLRQTDFVKKVGQEKSATS